MIINYSSCTIRSRPVDEGHRGDISESLTSGSLKLTDSSDHTPSKPISTSTENEEGNIFVYKNTRTIIHSYFFFQLNHTLRSDANFISINNQFHWLKN